LRCALRAPPCPPPCCGPRCCAVPGHARCVWRLAIRRARPSTGSLPRSGRKFPSSSNLLKIAEGGWLPLTFAALVPDHDNMGAPAPRPYGATLVSRRKPRTGSCRIPERRLPRVEGTTVFLTRSTQKGLSRPHHGHCAISWEFCRDRRYALMRVSLKKHAATHLRSDMHRRRQCR